MKKVFISHSSKNSIIVNSLSGYLEHIGIKHNNIFCSSTISQGAKNGEELNARIGKAIKDSYLIIYLISQDFFNSNYCIEELGIGWYLAQECNKKCFYIILPDLNFEDIYGFVNSKINKFTLLDFAKQEAFISLTGDMLKVLSIRQKNYSSQAQYIDIFFNSVKSELENLKTNHNTNKMNELQKELSTKTGIIENLKCKLNEKDSYFSKKLLEVELETIEKNFFLLGSSFGITEKKYKEFSKSFWFGMINRYEELVNVLKIDSKDYHMELLLASIYAFEGNQKKSYYHYMEYVKYCDSNIFDSDFAPFTERFSVSMREIIQLLKKKIKKEKEGIIKDAYIETMDILECREKNLGKVSD